MVELRFDIVGIGNAVLDVTSKVDDQFIQLREFPKGSMVLIDAQVANDLSRSIDVKTLSSGGSAANTVACVALLGGRGAFIGKVKDDSSGQAFVQDIKALGVNFDTTPTVSGASTARCFVFVTPDAQRTMRTYLGASVELSPEDISEDTITAAKVIYLEGYLWDPPKAKEAFIKAAELAKKSGRQVALSLSDTFCVERYRSEFLELINSHIDILFANEDEILSLYQVENFNDVIKIISSACSISVLTRGEKGSVVVEGRKILQLDTHDMDVVDTTGAGDAYAGGFLYGYTSGKSLNECGKIGAATAAEVIKQFGARPGRQLRDNVENLCNVK